MKFFGVASILLAGFLAMLQLNVVSAKPEPNIVGVGGYEGIGGNGLLDVIETLLAGGGYFDGGAGLLPVLATLIGGGTPAIVGVIPGAGIAGAGIAGAGISGIGGDTTAISGIGNEYSKNVDVDVVNG